MPEVLSATAVPFDISTCRSCRTRPYHEAHRLPPGVERMALMTADIWPAGQTLQILFGAPPETHDNPAVWGTQAQRHSLLEAAADIERYANLRFKELRAGDLPKFANAQEKGSYFRANPTIRVSFDFTLGSWSDVGKELLLVHPDWTTLNIGWLNDPGRDRHELLHAAGCVHEHQAFPVEWNEENCYLFFGGPPNNWSRQMVREQVLDPIDPSLLTRTAEIDVDSIMYYAFDRQLVRDPRFATPPKTTFSAGDKAMLGRMWPYPGKKAS